MTSAGAAALGDAGSGPAPPNAGFAEAVFLGAQVAAKIVFMLDQGLSKGFLSRPEYNELGPTAIHDCGLHRPPRTFYLESVPLRYVSVGGFEDPSTETVGGALWLQSRDGERCGGACAWYALGRPRAEYARYFRAFAWLADLAKHVLAYLQAHAHANVTLQHFRADFDAWLRATHTSPPFRRWRARYGRAPDWRHAVVAHADFLLKQAVDLDAQTGRAPVYTGHLLWHELSPAQQPNLAMPVQPQRVAGTIVTPYVRRCFARMEWGDLLVAKAPSREVEAARQLRCEAMGFNMANRGGEKRPLVKPRWNCPRFGDVCVGDVVAVPRDENSRWKTDENLLWFAFVQDIRPPAPSARNQRARLYVIWMYRPAETIIGDLTYPHAGELFLSNHCNCGDPALYSTEVVKKVDVAWFASESSAGGDGHGHGQAGHFVRQTYHNEDAVFSTLSEQDFVCACRKDTAALPTYLPGDTVLVETITAKDELALEPAEVVAADGDGEEVRVRVLARRAGVDTHTRCRPNELLYTRETREVSVEQIARKCHVFVNKCTK
ncbi:DNA methyltransferase Dim-2, partial [Ascosphaera acerosa]